MPCMFVYRATEFSGGGAWVGAAGCWESVAVGGWGEMEGWVERIMARRIGMRRIKRGK
jgi:hypothetical protein